MVRFAASVSTHDPEPHAPVSRLSHDAFADLFNGLREGMYVGLVGPDDSATLAVNPHLRSLFGWPADVPDSHVLPLDPDRFVDDQARAEFLKHLQRDGTARDYLLRLADALRELGEDDAHVFAIERHLRDMERSRGVSSH